MWSDRFACVSTAFVLGAACASLIAYFGIWIFPPGCDACAPRYYTNNYLTFITLLGSLFGLARLWLSASGPWRATAAVLALLSFGLFAWFCGSVTWSYYNFAKHIPYPYPSWADAGYFAHATLTFIAILTLFRIPKVPVLGDLMKPWPVIAAIASAVYVVMRAASTLRTEHDVIKIAFDIAYPVAGSVNAILLFAFLFGAALEAFTASRARIATAATALLAGSLLLALGDFFFNYGTSPSALPMLGYLNGNWSDGIYLGGLTAMAAGVLIFPLDAQVGGPPAAAAG